MGVQWIYRPAASTSLAPARAARSTLAYIWPVHSGSDCLEELQALNRGGGRAAHSGATCPQRTHSSAASRGRTRHSGSCAWQVLLRSAEKKEAYEFEYLYKQWMLRWNENWTVIFWVYSHLLVARRHDRLVALEWSVGSGWPSREAPHTRWHPTPKFRSKSHNWLKSLQL